MMGWNSAVEVIACIFRTGINGGGPIAPGRLIPPPYPILRASKYPEFAGDLPIFDQIMKISRSPDLE